MVVVKLEPQSAEPGRREICKAQERYAVKIIAKNQTSSDFVNRFLPRELDILPRIEHPNIVKVYRILQVREKVFIIMELAEHGDLLDHIRVSPATLQSGALYGLQTIRRTTSSARTL